MIEKADRGSPSVPGRATFLHVRRLALFSLLVASGPFLEAAAATQRVAKQVLVFHSFGQHFADYQDFAAGFQRVLAELSPDPVEYLNVPLESARLSDGNDEAPFVTYVHALTANRKLDLVVSVGGPAARFCVQERERLFPSVPLLMTGVENRMVTKLNADSNSIFSSFVLDLPGVIENILKLLPDTTDIVVVLGGSPLSKAWLAATREDFAGFDNRVRFTWINELSLEEMKRKVAALPPHTAIFFGEVHVDAAGIPHERHTALTGLHEVANAPIFGIYDTQLDRGIVGGPLVSLAEMSKQAAEVALRVLSGEKLDQIERRVLQASAPIYDARELERWGIDEARLPPGSIVRFRRPKNLGGVSSDRSGGIGDHCAAHGSDELATHPTRAAPGRRTAGTSARSETSDGARGRAETPRARAPRRLQPTTRKTRDGRWSSGALDTRDGRKGLRSDHAQGPRAPDR